MQWLIVLLLIVGVYLFLRPKKQSCQKQEEIMLECQECGTYVSSKESINKSGKHYCSNECALKNLKG